MYVLAHLSDLHATAVRVRQPRDFLNKRALGWLSWIRRRRHEHRGEVLEALVRDLASMAPDHVAVTGDLTNLGLAEEFEGARRWLERLGGPGRVFVVPGNHDAYIASPQSRSWEPWAPYLEALDTPPPRAAGEGVAFPSVRRSGPLALVGLSSARASAPFLATGRLGDAQRRRLERALCELGEAGLFRVVLIHHPPIAEAVSRRRRLTDAAELGEVLARAGAELVLHGHMHRTHVGAVAGPAAAIPVVGVPSSSALGLRHPARRARYHLYRIERGPGAQADRFRVSCQVRGWDEKAGCFRDEGELELLAAAARNPRTEMGARSRAV